MSAINTIRVGTYPDIVHANAGNERIIEGWRVEFVTYSQPHHRHTLMRSREDEHF